MTSSQSSSEDKSERLITDTSKVNEAKPNYKMSELI